MTIKESPQTQFISSKSKPHQQKVATKQTKLNEYQGNFNNTVKDYPLSIFKVQSGPNPQKLGHSNAYQKTKSGENQSNKHQKHNST